MNQDTITSLTQVEVGLDAEQFLKTKLGQYLSGVALQESDLVKNDLLHVNPKDEKKITELQIKGRVAEQALKWMVEAIRRGQQAEHELQIREAEEMD